MSTMASRNERVPRFSVYQLGRGSEPMIVVGSSSPSVALSMGESSVPVGAFVVVDGFRRRS